MNTKIPNGNDEMKVKCAIKQIETDHSIFALSFPNSRNERLSTIIV